MSTSRRTFLSSAVAVPLTYRVFGERRLHAGPFSSATDPNLAIAKHGMQ